MRSSYCSSLVATTTSCPLRLARRATSSMRGIPPIVSMALPGRRELLRRDWMTTRVRGTGVLVVFGSGVSGRVRWSGS